MRRSLLILILLFTSLIAETMSSRTRLLMGTYATITLPDRENGTTSELFSRLETIERSLSTFDPNASLARLNATHAIPYDPILADALRLSTDYYRQTKGYFDVTIGSITKSLYHFGETTPHSPTKAQLHNAIRNIDGFHIGTTQITSEEGIVIDLGGMGKGFAVDRAAELLKRKGITQGIIALSGDIRCLHRCTVGIQSPFDEEALIAKVTAKIENLSISTSGTYRRYATQKSEHHLIDPKSGEQGQAFVSVTLLSSADNAKIDAYATAVSVMSREEALAFLKMHDDIGFVVIKKNAETIAGNLKKFASIVWIGAQSDHQSNPSSTKKAATKRNIKSGFKAAASNPNSDGR